jgi:hypothetical protein
MQRYVANVGITASALRNAGDSGFVSAARAFLANLDLKPLAEMQPLDYPKWLNDQTQALMEKFPIKLWGLARKSVNIFMVMASLNRFLCAEYGLDRFENALEVPMDNIVVKELRRFGQTRKIIEPKEFPVFAIKTLDSTNSEKYQKVAERMAQELGIPRGRLDVRLWCSAE